MSDPLSQRLCILPGSYVVEHLPGHCSAPDTDGWLSVVRVPEGLTVVRPAAAGTADAWFALYGGDTAHGLDLPGMLSALLLPLARAAVPVFVASTFHADVLLVPEARRDEAMAALRRAGHEVVARG
jgi:uncharacterized protein